MQRDHLTTNYRSHPSIINVCNNWMTSFDWSDAEGTVFRTAKTIRTIPRKETTSEDAPYPAVLSISSVSVVHEAEQFAELVCWLKQQGTIDDYTEVALLLHSVKPWMSKPYIDALKENEIPTYCPGAAARSLTIWRFRLLVGCLARILGYKPGVSDAISDENDYLSYISDCRKQLANHCQKFSVLEQQLHVMEEEYWRLPRIQHKTRSSAWRLFLSFAVYRTICFIS